jgi:hypothetical protein
VDPPSPSGLDNDDDGDICGPSSSPLRAPSPSSPLRARSTRTPPAIAKGKKTYLIAPTGWNPQEAEGCRQENRPKEEISIRDDQRGTGGAYVPRGDRSFQT